MIKFLTKLLAYPKSRHLQIVLYKSYADLMAEASRLYVGYLWWVIEPVIDMGVYYVIFGVVLNNKTPEFIPFLLIGTVIWRWMQTTVLIGASTIHASRSLMDHVHVPKAIFPTVTLITNTFKFLIVFLLLIAFMLIYGYRIDVTWTAIPLLLAVELLFIAGLTYLFAAAVPFFPDLRIVLDSSFKVLLFLSGIFFPLSNLPESVLPYLNLNPVVHIIESYRAVIMHNQWPDWPTLALVAAISGLGVFVGMTVISRNDTIYPKLSI